MRKKKKQQQEATAQAAAPPSAPVAAPQQARTSGGYSYSELVTFDGKGNPSTIVYTTDSVGRSVKTRKGGRARH